MASQSQNTEESNVVAKQEEVPAEDPATMTPAARAQNYFDEQMKVYNKFVTDFASDIKMLNEEPDFTGKFGGIEKFKKDLQKKNDQVERRQKNEWEECHMNFGANENGINKILDKMFKTISDPVRKAKVKAVSA